MKSFFSLTSDSLVSIKNLEKLFIPCVQKNPYTNNINCSKVICFFFSFFLLFFCSFSYFFYDKIIVRISPEKFSR